MNEADYNFLMFDDYIREKDFDNKDWITVIQHNEQKIEDGKTNELITLSVMIPNKPEFISEVNSRHHWELGWDSFKDEPPIEGASKGWYPGRAIEKEGVPFGEFLIEKYSNTFKYYVINADFIKRFNLKFDPENKRYVDPQNNEEVIVLLKANHIKIKTRYLKDYLRTGNMVLVRYHDHRRAVKKSPNEIMGGKKIKRTEADLQRNYFIESKKSLMDSRTTYTRLLGKDLILPN